jgi:signal transduction histidine kinase
MSPSDSSDQPPAARSRRPETTVHCIHDLNNLLTIIAGCVDALVGQLSTVGALDDLAVLQRALSRAFLLTMDLMGSDAAPSNQRLMINLNHAVTDVEGLLRRLLGPIELTMNLRATQPWVVAHPLDIERILINLTLNAVEAIGDRGLVTLETATLAPAASSASNPPSSVVRLTVSDTGRGITPDLRAGLLNMPRTTHQTRHGLGLRSVNDIVQQLDGLVHIESRAGSGTHVHVDFRLAG